MPCLETPSDHVARVDDGVRTDVSVIADDERELAVATSSWRHAEHDEGFDDRTRSENTIRVDDRRAAIGQGVTPARRWSAAAMDTGDS